MVYGISDREWAMLFMFNGQEEGEIDRMLVAEEQDGMCSKL